TGANDDPMTITTGFRGKRKEAGKRCSRFQLQSVAAIRCVQCVLEFIRGFHENGLARRGSVGEGTAHMHTGEFGGTIKLCSRVFLRHKRKMRGEGQKHEGARQSFSKGGVEHFGQAVIVVLKLALSRHAVSSGHYNHVGLGYSCCRLSAAFNGFNKGSYLRGWMSSLGDDAALSHAVIERRVRELPR